MERKLVSIQQIKSISPVSGADKIEVAEIKDWKVVVNKGIHKVNDFVIFYEIDSFLPIQPRYDFLLKGSKSKKILVDGIEQEGVRIKTKKIRGQISQGLIMPIVEFGGIIPDSRIVIGEDITEFLGVIKYEPPIPAQLAGTVKGFFPSYIPKTDEERIQNMADVLTGFYVTEKLDGTSVTFFRKDGVFGVCSRNLELTETKDNTQWRIARELNLPEKLPDNFVIQGELVGEGIQGNPLKISGQKVYFYNVYKLVENATYLGDGMYLDFTNFKGFIEGLGLETVPIIDDNFTLPKTVAELLTYADGKSLINPNCPREGVVIRPKIEMTYKDQRLSFKVISNEYLLKNEV
jgi:RNA ligase (TIGR02306 family)